MPNVLFTQTCVRACPYCFAKKHMSETLPEDHLTWVNLIYLADFFISSGENRFPILGGEPTLHPEFNDMVLYLLERNFEIFVFTSGIMADSKLEEAEYLFSKFPPQKFSFIINLNDPIQTKSSLAEQESLKRFLQTFGNRSTAGFNIYRPDFNLEFIFQIINEYGLARTIRLGIAHPIPGTNNVHIPLSEMDTVIEKLFSYTRLFERLRIKPGLDCGFPMCRFKDWQLAWLHKNTRGRDDFSCGPVFDIGPDMTVWTCFPLSNFHKKSIYEFNNIKEIYDYYKKLHDIIHVEIGGIYEECDICTYREEGRCLGGCAAHSVEKFNNEKKVRMAEIYS